MSLLEVNHIDVHYGDFLALKDVSIHVEPGNIVSLIGLSGIAAAETRKYLWEDRLDEEADPEDNPM